MTDPNPTESPAGGLWLLPVALCVICVLAAIAAEIWLGIPLKTS